MKFRVSDYHKAVLVEARNAAEALEKADFSYKLYEAQPVVVEHALEAWQLHTPPERYQKEWVPFRVVALRYWGKDQ